jgi:hypothetical protein
LTPSNISQNIPGNLPRTFQWILPIIFPQDQEEETSLATSKARLEKKAEFHLAGYLLYKQEMG